MNDLEQLLKQYGEDLRRQDAIARRLRHKAMWQRGAMTLCGVVLLAVAGITLLKTPPIASEPLMAEIREDGSASMHAVAEADEAGEKPSHRYTAAQAAERDAADKVEVAANDDLASEEDNKFLAEVTPVESMTNDEVFEDEGEPSTVKKEPLRHVPQMFLAEADEVYVDVPKSRVRWDAHLGTGSGSSMLAQLSTGNNYGIGLNSPEALSAELTLSAQLLGMVSGNVGVSVVVASTGRSNIEVGIAAEGYLERMSASFSQKKLYRIKGSSPYGSAGGYSINVITKTITETLYGIDLSVPLTWQFYPRGKERMGWQMRIAPARRMLMSDHQAKRYGLYINPWKLNVGAGMVLHRGAVKNVGFTANLLPTYQYGALHEFGIAVGF